MPEQVFAHSCHEVGRKTIREIKRCKRAVSHSLGGHASGKAFCRAVAFSSSLLLLVPSNATAAHSTRPFKQSNAKSQSTAIDNTNVPLLEPGKPVERELAGGQAHSYQITLSAGQYLHAIVEQRGIDVVVALFGPDGRKIAGGDYTSETIGEEPVFFIADTTGSHLLEIRTVDKSAPRGKYEARIAELRVATEQDKNRVTAEQTIMEAMQLYAEGTKESKVKAREKFERALPYFHAAGFLDGEADTLYNIASVYWGFGEYQTMVEYLEQALTLFRSTGNKQREAKLLANIATGYFNLGNLEESLSHLNQALSICRTIGDRHTEAFTLSNLGANYKFLGEHKKALDYFSQALPLRRAVGDRSGEGRTLVNLGLLYSSLGETQRALDSYNDAVSIFRAVGDKQWEGYALMDMGVVYSALGESQNALDHFNKVLAIMRSMGDKRVEGDMYSYIGSEYIGSGEYQKALDSLNQALSLYRATGYRLGEAEALNNIGITFSKMGERSTALEYFSQALPIHQGIKNSRGVAATLTYMGNAHRELGDRQKALDLYNQALPLRQAAGDLSGEASTLYGIARVERDLHEFSEARSRIEAVLSTVDSLRANITSQQLRASYLATAQQYYQFYVDLLMQMHKQRPSERFDAAALQASERGRARSLLESLNEARADIRQGVDPVLLERERSVQQLLTAKTERQIRLLVGKHTDEQAAEAAKEIEALKADFQLVEAQIKRDSPRYAALTQPQPLNAREIQELLDQDSLLLEYSLGDDRSYLWVATPSAITSYELPKRAEIEPLAKRFYELLTEPNQQTGAGNASRGLRQAKANAQNQSLTDLAATLSRMLLGPAASQLGKSRLVIVADGALQFVPFGALTSPTAGSPSSVQSEKSEKKHGPAEYRPLIADHEIANLPSSSTLAVIRRESEGRKPADKMVAVIADPVFDEDDERVTASKTGAKSGDPAARPPAERALFVKVKKAAAETGLRSEGLSIPRLPGTRLEAAKILSLVPVNARMQALDFDANRATATSDKLGEYRYVHFATHGFLNSASPELSGIVLSMVDQQGKPQNGFLLSHEIFNLRLPAELVVLSACQTGLGKEVKGEGLVGLTRGFMYAGAPRVIVSLWNVNDEATAELMGRLYKGILQKKMPPAEALRAAQIEMWKQKEWRAPYYWAAFALQGEWK